jgi:hypothetical protein
MMHVGEGYGECGSVKGRVLVLEKLINLARFLVVLYNGCDWRWKIQPCECECA